MEFDFRIDISVDENGKKSPQYTLDTDLAGELTFQDLLTFFRKTLITIAGETLKEEQAFGFDLDPIITVDGSQSKPVDQVSPFGTIEITSRVAVGGLILEAYESILARSPVLTGAYKSNNVVCYNFLEVARDLGGLQNWLSSKGNDWKDSDVIQFINIQPYARKLERLGVRAKSSRMRFRKSRNKQSGAKILAPNGVYFLVTRSLQRKYKRVQSIKFSFIPGSRIGLPAYFKKKRSKTEKSRTYLYPMISITVRGEGSTSV